MNIIAPHRDAKPLYLPPLYQDSAEQGRIILRDGSTATIHVCRAEDRSALHDFFRRLSPDSLRRRFFSASKPPLEELDELCDSSGPAKQLTLVVTRVADGAARLIAVASYFAKDAQTVEVALAVEDVFHGMGLGSMLFERLALLAARQGFTRCWALTHTDNRPMIEVFRRSGFELQERMRGEELEMQFSLVPTAASAARSEWLDRMFTTASLRPVFQPTSVAVIGASREPSSIGYRILEALVEPHGATSQSEAIAAGRGENPGITTAFQGPIYPVNPKTSLIGSTRTYPSLRDVPGPVDLAVIVVPKDAVLAVVDDCAAHGVKALIVISAGFAETGEAGRALQRQLAERVRNYGMRLVGPNCLGVVSTDPSVRLNASFSPVYPPEGRVAMLSQSGALGIAILSLAQQQQLGLSSFVSVGNKADVSGNDLIQYWEQDPRTNTILLYLESFGNPRRFSRIARRVARAKPIIAVKGGRTSAGRRAAGSHTAALAASTVAVDALFRQTGVVRAETLEEMFDLASAFSTQPLPTGRRVGIITNAGGPGILCTDACEAGGLEVTQFSPATMAKLAEFLPSTSGLSNPVDMIASATPEQYQRAIATVMASGEVDSVIILYIPVVAQTEAILRGITAGVRDGRGTPAAGTRGHGSTISLLACVMGREGGLPPVQVDGQRIPTYAFPESAGRVLSRLVEYAQWRANPPGTVLDFENARPREAQTVCREALAQRGAGWLTVEEIRSVLLAMGLPVAPGGVANTPEEAVALAQQAGFPVAAKLASHRIVHKSDRGGVLLNLRNASAVRAAFDAIRRSLHDAGELEAMDGVLIQPMVRGGVEVMVGVVDDPSFGPLIAFGLGGTHVEILKDVSFRIAPLTDRDITEMIHEIRGFRLLEGYRGHPPADVAAIAELLARISRLVEDVPEIVEIDLNPVFALPPGSGCSIVDARIRVEPHTSG